MRRGASRQSQEMKLAVLILSCLLSGAATRADQQPKLLWSISLNPQGFHAAMWGGQIFTAVRGVAATSKIVGVSLYSL